MGKKHARNAVLHIIFPIVIQTWVREYILSPDKQSIILTGNPTFMRRKHGKILLKLAPLQWYLKKKWPPY